MKIDSKEEWDRLEKIAYKFLDNLDIKTIIKECHHSELNYIMAYIEKHYGKIYLNENNFNSEEECIFNRIDQYDFEHYLYNRYGDDVYISWEEFGFIFFNKED